MYRLRGCRQQRRDHRYGPGLVAQTITICRHCKVLTTSTVQRIPDIPPLALQEVGYHRVPRASRSFPASARTNEWAPGLLLLLLLSLHAPVVEAQIPGAAIP